MVLFCLVLVLGFRFGCLNQHHDACCFFVSFHDARPMVFVTGWDDLACVLSQDHALWPPHGNRKHMHYIWMSGRGTPKLRVTRDNTRWELLGSLVANRAGFVTTQDHVSGNSMHTHYIWISGWGTPTLRGTLGNTRLEFPGSFVTDRAVLR